MKRYIFGIIAVVIAVGAVAFTKAKTGIIKQDPNMASYYFQFIGLHGDESDVAEWKEISLNDYNLLPCSGSAQGCKIATTSVSNPSQPFPARQISSVPVDGNDVPQTTMINYDVQNKP